MPENTDKIKYIRFLVLLALLVLISIPVIYMMYMWGVIGLFNHITNTIVNTTGVNTYLAKAVVLMFLAPLFIFFRLGLSLSPDKRKKAHVIIASYIAIFYVSMFLLTKEQNFDFETGQAIKYYADTPEGIRYFDKPGWDPKYHIKLRPVDPNIARKEAFDKNPPVRIENPGKFFDFATKEPLVWYYEASDGTFEFYNQPGNHPRYGEELKSITPEVVRRYERQESQRNAAAECKAAIEKVRQLEKEAGQSLSAGRLTEIEKKLVEAEMALTDQTKNSGELRALAIQVSGFIPELAGLVRAEAERVAEEKKTANTSTNTLTGAKNPKISRMKGVLYPLQEVPCERASEGWRKFIHEPGLLKAGDSVKFHPMPEEFLHDNQKYKPRPQQEYVVVEKIVDCQVIMRFSQGKEVEKVMLELM